MLISLFSLEHRLALLLNLEFSIKVFSLIINSAHEICPSVTTGSQCSSPLFFLLEGIFLIKMRDKMIHFSVSVIKDLKTEMIGSN